MEKTKTKKALIMSVLSMVLCIAMLVGMTFAWFTDTASTGVNKIQAGTLKVDIVDANGNTLEGDQLNWQKAAGHENEAVLWEPGCKYNLESFKIVNKGSLALKYKVVVTGITGDAKLLDAIDFTISDADGNVQNVDLNNWEGKLLPKGAAKTADADVEKTSLFTITGKMKTTAGNEYQDLCIDGIGITVYATQLEHEFDSNGNEYDKDATYANKATIAGLSGSYDTLTAAAKAWRESKGVVTSGGTFGGNNLGTVDSISWLISGAVELGDGAGVVGNNGAGDNIFAGGYLTPAPAVKNVIVKGVNGAVIKKTSDAYRVSAGGQNVVYDGITFEGEVRIDSNPQNVTFKNCTFKEGLRMPHTAANANVTVEGCTFTGGESSGYAIFMQGATTANVKIISNEISACQRGINVQAGNSAVVTINNNRIHGLTGKTENGFTYGAAIQLTSAKTFTVTGNTISNVPVNAFHIYSGCSADSITIKNNNISADYLCWNQANYNKITSSGNTVNITNTGKCVTKTEVIDSSFTLN